MLPMAEAALKAQYRELFFEVPAVLAAIHARMMGLAEKTKPNM
jgi:hypothetical protein